MVKTHISVTVASASDIPTLRSLEARTDTAAHWSAEMYDRIFRAGSLPRMVLLLREDGNTTGFIVALCSGAEWEIENVVIDHGARRKGSGTRLVHALLERAADGGAERVFLEVRKSNRPARGLYEKCAFKECGRRPRYYSDPPEDAVVYSFHLTAEKPKYKPSDSK